MCRKLVHYNLRSRLVESTCIQWFLERKQKQGEKPAYCFLFLLVNVVSLFVAPLQERTRLCGCWLQIQHNGEGFFSWTNKTFLQISITSRSMHFSWGFERRPLSVWNSNRQPFLLTSWWCDRVRISSIRGFRERNVRLPLSRLLKRNKYRICVSRGLFTFFHRCVLFTHDYSDRKDRKDDC